MQSQFTDGQYVRDPTEWFRAHAADYERTLGRLADVRAVTLAGELGRAARNLRLSYLNAVMSIQTEKDRHERAFTAYVAGSENLKDAMLMTVYGGQKHGWASRTLDMVDWRNIALAVRAHVREGRIEDLLEMQEELVGVSYAKWAFTLAMAGVWEVACLDSNVSGELGISARSIDSASAYADVIADIRDAIDEPIPPFLAQWCIYDFARGEHARHMPFFHEVEMAE